MSGTSNVNQRRAAGAMPPAKLARQIRVLIIDDDREVADSLGMLMESFGAEVRVAYDGASGVEVAHEFRPEIACIDVRMPGIDGYETARRLRERLGERTPKLVALTGLSDHDGDGGRALRDSFDMRLPKPAPMDSLESLARHGALEGLDAWPAEAVAGTGAASPEA
jgi:CheY-like chemotaxis protein